MSDKVNLKFACPIAWEEMQTVDERVRFCSQCTKKVQDFSKDQKSQTKGVEGLHSIKSVVSTELLKSAPNRS